MRAPMKRSLTAWSTWPLASVAFAMVTVLKGRLPAATSRKQCGKVVRAEGKQDAVITPRIGVEADQRMAIEIFHGVGDDAVLAERDHDIRRTKDEVRQKAALDRLIPAPSLQRLQGAVLLLQIDVVLALIIGEIGAEMST